MIQQNKQVAIKRISMYVCIIVLALMGCILVACTQADNVSHNLSQEADNFNILREIKAFNTRTGEAVFACRGNFSLTVDMDNDLNIIGEDENGNYYKHFVHLSQDVSYVCIQVENTGVSRYAFEINYNPKFLPLFVPSYVD